MSKQVKQHEHEAQKQEVRKLKSNFITILAVVVVVAIAVVVFMVISRSNMASQNTTLQEQLADSQAAWQTVSDEKEELQTQLSTANDALRGPRPPWPSPPKR